MLLQFNCISQLQSTSVYQPTPVHLTFSANFSPFLCIRHSSSPHSNYQLQSTSLYLSDKHQLQYRPLHCIYDQIHTSLYPSAPVHLLSIYQPTAHLTLSINQQPTLLFLLTEINLTLSVNLSPNSGPTLYFRWQQPTLLYPETTNHLSVSIIYWPPGCRFLGITTHHLQSMPLITIFYYENPPIKQAERIFIIKGRPYQWPLLPYLMP
jgi:hypothetical protein